MRQVTAGAAPGQHSTPGPPDLSATPENLTTLPGPEAPAGAGTEKVDCRAFYARMASGVSVVTAQSPDGPAGSTVSAVTSLSTNPPLLLICLGSASRTLAVIEAQGRFGVNLLGESQQARAELFADPRIGVADRFVTTEHHRVLAVPVLTDTLGWAVCLVEDIRRYGDHCLVVGRIAAAHTAAGRPLLWHDRSFHSLDGHSRELGPRPPLENS